MTTTNLKNSHSSQQPVVALELNGIGKEFPHRHLLPLFLRRKHEVLAQGANACGSSGTVTALSPIHLSFYRGEAVAIIGDNGAGKSTLLKLLARVLPPTFGSATLYGTTASLLDVGVGFNHQLTGRENIYFNGALLGMAKIFIKHHLKEIVTFSELEQWIDTPLKHYSTGMRLRLAFAITTVVKADIYLLDEVLGVGDQAFQERCVAHLQEQQKNGAVILLASHNTPLLKALCTREITLKNGAVISDRPLKAISLPT